MFLLFDFFLGSDLELLVGTNGFGAGYIAVWLWRTLGNGEKRGWFSVSWRVACFFPGISFLILIIINSLLWGSGSTGAIPFTTFLVLKSLSGPVSAMLYLGYSLFMVIAIMLATGEVGFLTSFFFVHRLFSSVKID
ncbi:hypothetical protein CTI12_AA184410 [Artemisia annua]|uniref:Transmembrane 9 superfamily member n=1 Tax=Artemisia annua TaxID=35608 RepID=A0A2U1MP26_ARTAN|nr:hypothetical protein CTI12_AA184410 [Artemisia annua]